MLDVLVLSVLQGVAEFLPISSSGHLVLGKTLLGLDEPGIRLDVFLHVGTLISICLFYFSVIRRIVRNLEWDYALKVVVSAVPAGVVGFLFKNRLEVLFASPRAVGGALLFTGLVLLVTKFLPRGDSKVTFGRAILMGIAQAVAILPGVSRSGMTIVAARVTKMGAENSAEFSFLMSIPPIAGAALLEIAKSLEMADKVGQSAIETPWPQVLIGSVVAAVVGYFALKFLLKALKSNCFWWFGPYCLLAGVVTLVFI